MKNWKKFVAGLAILLSVVAGVATKKMVSPQDVAGAVQAVDMMKEGVKGDEVDSAMPVGTPVSNPSVSPSK